MLAQQVRDVYCAVRNDAIDLRRVGNHAGALVRRHIRSRRACFLRAHWLTIANVTTTTTTNNKITVVDAQRTSSGDGDGDAMTLGGVTRVDFALARASLLDDAR